ncbi:MAG: glycosyltransferase family 1 protein [Ardenticatenia bacterium]|nr:MAG: glycosyltransferase family 1 protein [Ardenticatenia bacterium]
MSESIEPLTIALICNLYPPYIVGGNEILARDVAEALRARGHTVHILTGYGEQLPRDGFTHGVLDINLDRKEDLFLGGLPLTAARVMRWKIFNTRTYRNVRAKLATLRPDMVIAWNLYQASMSPLAAARGGDWPVVAHPADKWLVAGLWDVGLQVPVHNRKQQMALMLLRSGIQPVVRRFVMPDYVLAVSEFIRQLHIARGFPAEQSLATYLGVPADMFAYRERTFPGERPWRLVFAAQLWHGKGPQVAIEAVARLRARNDIPPVMLDIYGSGTDNFMAFLHKKIADLGVGDVVRVHGFVPRAQLARVFQEGDVYLFCSIWDEPFSGGLLEALATGIPTIATTTGGTPEAIRDGENGLLVPPDDPAALEQALVRLMHDADLYHRLSQNGAADVRHRWTFDRYIDRLERVYTAIVQAHRRGERANLVRLAAQVAPHIHG